MFPLPSLTAWHFLAAGALCALGPVIIHLLNRRRYKVVQWGAMDFLREAMQRNRRIMQLRDILLLVLRTAAVLLFGLALARPYFSERRESSSDRLPVHAIVLLDNSLSMGYESLEGTLLTKAKDKARAYIDRLPPGSKISIIPVCGSPDGFSPDPYDTKESAIEALDKIETVDRSATFLSAVGLARQASAAAPQLAKRVVFLTDQQQANWRGLSETQLADHPPMQVVDVSSPSWRNTWIADLSVQDGLADIETPTTIVAKIEYAGLESQRKVEIKLYLGDTAIGQRYVTLAPGEGAQEVDFQYVFSGLTEMPEPQRPVFVTLRAAIERDELPADDERFLAVPVVAALPVVFVDQYGAEDEDPIRFRFGETLRLRKLLAPKAVREDAPRQIVKIRHVKAGEVTQETLADARLVVVAGLPTIDESAVELLREYVQQGGQLVIAAGGEFNPQAFSDAAWKDGAGILPAPLAAEPIGEIPEVAGARVVPFFLSYESLAAEDYFHLAGLGEQELRDLYAEPFFFKAVHASTDEETLKAWREAEAKRVGEELALVADVEQRRRELESTSKDGVVSGADQAALKELEDQLRDVRPQWLSWGDAESEPALSTRSPEDRERAVQTLVRQGEPRVLARFDNAQKSPFLIERQIGAGKVVFAASGLSSSWNTLLTTNATVIFDRLLRGMIEQTLPRRNFPPRERLTLPLVSDEHDLIVALQRPQSASAEPLDIGYISGEQRGVTISGLYQRGVYRVAAYRSQPVSIDSSQAADKPLWEVPLAVGGDAEESNLAPLAAAKLDELSQTANLRFVAQGDEISLAGATIRGQNFWWWLALAAVLVCLIVEMGILAWPNLRSTTSTA
ncbi:MAG TPA: BatA domain-containing protein [Pirellulaceae bacterium]|nr:BatA domain-containing protein [Pirellulaceae bacterium]